MVPRKLMAGLLFGGLSGCAVGPDFVSPIPPVAESHNYLDNGQPIRSPLPVLAGTTPAEPDVEWWSAFHDPLLARLEARVADENLDVRTATVRLAESRAQLGTAVAAELPTINGTGSIYRQQYSQNGIVSLITSSGAVPASLTNSISNPITSYTVGFDASWELDLWGKVRRQVESSAAEVAASADSRRAVLVSNLAELARDYVQLRGAQNQIRIIEDNVRVNQELLDLTRTRQQKGLVTGLDTSSAASQVEAIQAQLPQLLQQELGQVNAISLLLAQPPMALSAELVPPKPVPPIPPRVPIGVPSDLLLRRPDVQQSVEELHSATAQIGVAVGQFFPTVSITGSPTLNALDPGHLFQVNSLQYMNVGPSVSLPIFEGGRLKSNLVLQEAKQKEAALAYQKTVLQAWHDVVNALVALKADEARRARLSGQVGDARRALNLARARYSTGVDTFTTVLQQSQTVLQAEMNLSQAATGVSTDFVALYKALGGGWENTFPKGPLPPMPEPTTALLVNHQ